MAHMAFSHQSILVEEMEIALLVFIGFGSIRID